MRSIMSYDLKVGDTCMIVKCKLNPDYVGRTVTLVSCLIPDDMAIHNSNLGTKFKNDLPDRENAWVVNGNDQYRLVGKEVTVLSHMACFAESCLMKISGNPDKTKVSTQTLNTSN